MSGQVWSTVGHHDGRYYAEVIFGADTPEGAVGLFDEVSGTGTMLTAEGHIQETVDGVVTVMHFDCFPPLMAGDVVGIRADFDYGCIWFRVNGGDWNNGGVAVFEWPNERNTGAVGELTPYFGSYNINTEGAVLQNLDIPIAMYISANHVTISNCRMHFTDWYYGFDMDATVIGCTIEDCTIIGPGTAFTPEGGGGAQAGINGNGTFKRNNISNFTNGIMLNGPATIRSNYIHDLDAAGFDPHYDGIQITGSVPGTLIEHNRIMSRDTSCMILLNDFGPVSDVTINHNYCGSATPLGVGFGILISDERGGGPVTDITVTNNRIEPCGFDEIKLGGDAEASLSGNVDAFTGEPIP